MSQLVAVCPTCGTTLPFPRKFVGSGPASCEACSAEGVWERASADVLRLLDAPNSAGATPPGDAQLSWQAGHPRQLLPGLSLLGAAASAVGGAIGRGVRGLPPAGELPVFALGLVLVGAMSLVGARALSRGLERVVLRVTGRTLTVRTGPFGLVPRVRLEAGRMRQLYVTLRAPSVLERGRAPFPVPRYAVVAQLRDGTTTDVVSSLETAEHAVQLAQVLTYALDLRERPGLLAGGTPRLVVGEGAQVTQAP